MDFKTNPDAAGAGSGPPKRPDESLTQAVLKAIERLPEGQRQAITLYYMDGQSYPDIADFLSVPVSTVKGRMHAGRRRLKKEMAEMVETVLDANKPGRELTVRVLRQAVGKARRAGRRRDYQSLLALCDEALAALDKLPATPRRRQTRAEVLGWQGESKEVWLARPDQALTCHRAAMEIAADMGDLAGQASAMQAILATLGRSGDFGALGEEARRGLEVARAGGCTELEAICSAATDLCADPDRRHDTSRAGGFALGWFGISARRGRWVAEAPRRWDSRTGEGNLMLNLRCGTPARPTVLSWLYGPAAVLPRQPRVGDRWRGTFGSSFRSTPARALSAVSCVEAVDETLTVPAGRFRQCVRVRTTVRSAMSGPIPEQLAHSMKVLTGTRWSWFSPGVGLVRLVNVDRTDQLTDIVLADFGPGAAGREHLPLAPGNWWRFQWRGSHPEALLTETWRVVEARSGRAMVSCALHSREPDEIETKRLGRQTTAFLSKRSEPELQGHALLRRGGDTPAGLRRTATQLARLGQTGLGTKALFRLAWRQEKLGRTAQALRTWRELLDVTGGGWYAENASGRCFRMGEYEAMLEIALRAEEAARGGGLRGRADLAGLVELARWLSSGEKTGRVGGYCNGWSEVVSAGSQVHAGSRARGTCKPFSPARSGCQPMGLGMMRLLTLPIRKGRTWTDSWNDGTPDGVVVPVVKRTVEAARDCVTVPAGRFDKCARVRAEIRTAAGAGGATPDRRWQGYHDGVRIDWYAPGVGLVRVEHRHANGKITRIELVEFKVGPAGSRYLPVRVGNTWHYRWRDGNGRALFQEFWRVAGRKGKVTYVGFGAVELKRR